MLRAIVGPGHGAFKRHGRSENTGVFVGSPDELDAGRHTIRRKSGRHCQHRAAAQHVKRVSHAPGQRIGHGLALCFETGVIEFGVGAQSWLCQRGTQEHVVATHQVTEVVVHVASGDERCDVIRRLRYLALLDEIAGVIGEQFALSFFQIARGKLVRLLFRATSPTILVLT